MEMKLQNWVLLLLLLLGASQLFGFAYFLSENKDVNDYEETIEAMNVDHDLLANDYKELYETHESLTSDLCSMGVSSFCKKGGTTLTIEACDLENCKEWLNVKICKLGPKCGSNPVDWLTATVLVEKE